MKSVNTGSVIVETVLLIPVLILLIFGMIQIGSLLYMRHSLFELAYNAVRIAATNPNSTNATVQLYITQQLNNMSVTASQVLITPNNFTGANRGSLLGVAISVNANQLVFVPFPLNLSQMQIVVSASMVKEY